MSWISISLSSGRYIKHVCVTWGNLAHWCQQFWSMYHLFVQAYVVEDNKQLILEGQLHVALQSLGKEATSLAPKEVRPISHTHTHTGMLMFSWGVWGNLECESSVFQEAQEMVLLKFKSELPVPVPPPSAELSQLIKTNLHYPEIYTHPFGHNRSAAHRHTCSVIMTSKGL